MTEMPVDDAMLATVAELPPATRAAIAAHFTRRARSELRVGVAFAAMAERLAARGAPRVVVEGLAQSAEEEPRHAAICVQLATIYGGAPVPLPVGLEAPLPCFGEDDPDLEDALLVAGMCCVNETIATAWLGAGLEVATAPIAVAALRAHLADEIGHARIGWAYLASSHVSDATRRALSARLPALLAANLPGWERDDEDLPPEGVPAHGHLSAAASRAAIAAAVRDLVLPGFAHVGVDPAGAEGWLGYHGGPTTKGRPR